MLPCSVRRVASAAPQSPAAILASLGCSAIPRGTASAVGLAYRSNMQQRRRYSSSKPSRDNGSEGPPAPAADPETNEIKTASATEPATETKTKVTKATTSEIKAAAAPKPTKKRKAKEEPLPSLQDDSLPSVPSTQSMSANTLFLSSFFSLHRPMSVTQTGVPHIIDDDVFAAMFVPPPKAKAASEVISTLSRTVDSLEKPFANTVGSRGRSHEEADARELLRKLELRHSDGTETNIEVHLNTMSGQFVPFSTPPAPQPESASEAAQADAEAAGRDAAAVAEEPRANRVFKAMITIEEFTDEEGQVKWMAHIPELMEARDADPVRTPHIERMALRALKHEDRMRARRRGGNKTMQLISVKRQRKLKMKKKKYKKLMKRTRNARRKLERA